MSDLETTLKKFKKKKVFECHGPLSEESVNDMQESLGISFPEPYRVFLKKYGYFLWFGHAIYGYSEDEDYHTVVRTKELREEEIPDDFERIPREGCVLEDYGGGGYFFLFSKESARSGQVALFVDELYGGEADSWENFDAFVKYMLSL